MTRENSSRSSAIAGREDGRRTGHGSGGTGQSSAEFRGYSDNHVTYGRSKWSKYLAGTALAFPAKLPR